MNPPRPIRPRRDRGMPVAGNRPIPREVIIDPQAERQRRNGRRWGLAILALSTVVAGYGYGGLFNFW